MKKKTNKIKKTENQKKKGLGNMNKYYIQQAYINKTKITVFIKIPQYFTMVWT